MNAHLFVSSDGSLFDTRMTAWSERHPLRSNYSRTHTAITNSHDLRATLRAGAHVWPGGYPLYFVTSDGDALSFDSVRDNYAQCARAIRDNDSSGWRVVECAINWEDRDLICAHSGEPIEAAY
jgi:hypothetical protein